MSLQGLAKIGKGNSTKTRLYPWCQQTAGKRQPKGAHLCKDLGYEETEALQRSPAGATHGHCSCRLSSSKETHWANHAQLGSSNSGTQVPNTSPCPTAISALLQLSREPKPPSILQDAVILRPCQMATNQACGLTSQDCLWSSPARVVRWLRPTPLQKCWECISNGQPETCPNSYCYF